MSIDATIDFRPMADSPSTRRPTVEVHEVDAAQASAELRPNTRGRAELCSVAWAAACLAHESERHLAAAVDTVAAAHGALAADAEDDGARDAQAARRWATRRRRPARRWRGRGGCARSTTRAWRWRRPARPRSNWRPSTPRRPMN